MNANITRRFGNPVGLQQTIIIKIRQVFKVVESSKAADVSMQGTSDRNWCHICIEEIRRQEKCKENKKKLAKVK